ncbi:glycoside hydrolase family 2 protein [uncultured Dysgonomonas sp.]|uniref:beta-mannosidase n=1 Tax=uncultured Dysgonomonas sp. TaxID=206096 RepID=UPI00280402F7|nr:glycoside hydrolase family 2 protein [uncultured Dysgonomonas sp.]
MRRITTILLMIMSTILILNNLQASPILTEVKAGWKFKQARLNNWYPATVPGVVHTDLMDNGILEDPYFRLNERGAQWVDKEDWIYETTFHLDDETFRKENIDLYFKGLDTYADVYLNETKILEANNMFREWRVDVKNIIRQKDNQLKIYFHSPLKVDMLKWEALPFQYEAINDQSENGGLFNRRLSVFARKAGYHYGWDWGPRLVTSGIWRPVFVEAWDSLRIDNINYIQKNVSAKNADIETVLEIIGDKDMASTKVEITDEQSGKVLSSEVVNIQKGINKVKLNFTMKKPELWWSNGLGKPHLYTFNAKVSIDSKTVDNKSEKIGIRSVKLIRQPDKFGKSFYFELNGVPVFSKGANYIPCDIFLPRVTKEIYKKTILDAVDANMNMLRVWGGGIYEDDYFYELCDEYGIMVWQDFMFACSLYPAQGELLENIRQEAIDNVKRLRNHPSIAIWCGNNECLDAWKIWGWERDYTKKDPKIAETIWRQFYDQYFVVLPNVVKEYDPMASYTPSSPFTDIDGRRDKTDGDMHYWDTWQKGLPIITYNDEKSRYFSEYGFQSFPEWATVKLYAPEERDWNITSEVMMSHQRGGAHANQTIEKCLINEYGQPKDFQSFLYMSQVLQGDAMKIAMEAHRRDMGYCMGSLFWQHNDCWPVASWASRDYYGHWKAQHYFTREAFKEILVSPILDGDNLDIYIVSDRLKSTKGKLHISVMTLDGKIISEENKSINIPANASTKVYSETITKLMKGKAKNEILVVADFIDDHNKQYSNNYFLLNQKEINLPEANITYNIKVVKDGYEITLNSDKFARAVYLSVDEIDNFFEDNYFDLLPNKEKSIHVKTGLSPDDFRKQIKVISLKDCLQ